MTLGHKDTNVHCTTRPKHEEGQEHIQDVIQVDHGSIGIHHVLKGNVIVLVLVVLLRWTLGGKDEKVTENKEKGTVAKISWDKCDRAGASRRAMAL